MTRINVIGGLAGVLGAALGTSSPLRRAQRPITVLPLVLTQPIQ